MGLTVNDFKGTRWYRNKVEGYTCSDVTWEKANNKPAIGGWYMFTSRVTDLFYASQDPDAVKVTRNGIEEPVHGPITIDGVDWYVTEPVDSSMVYPMKTDIPFIVATVTYNRNLAFTETLLRAMLDTYGKFNVEKLKNSKYYRKGLTVFTIDDQTWTKVNANGGIYACLKHSDNNMAPFGIANDPYSARLLCSKNSHLQDVNSFEAYGNTWYYSVPDYGKNINLDCPDVPVLDKVCDLSNVSGNTLKMAKYLLSLAFEEIEGKKFVDGKSLALYHEKIWENIEIAHEKIWENVEFAVAQATPNQSSDTFIDKLFE